ncbi:MAG: hypothetical protein IIA72_19910 [Proteobacteria bacterium]|nr:hypothetical protein [Pseudomonadota bacterium]
MKYVRPEEVKSPKAYWYLFEVVLDRGRGNCAYALGEWEGKRRIGFRWNGNGKSPIGNPQSRGLATWTMLDPALHKAIVEILPEDKKSTARGFLGIRS